MNRPMKAWLGAEMHEASCEVQIWGASMLGHLSHGELDNKETVIAAGALAAIVAAMKGHRSSASLQERGCWALRNLALGDSKRQDAQCDPRARPQARLSCEVVPPAT